MLRHTMLIFITALFIGGCTLATDPETTGERPTVEVTELITEAADPPTNTPQPTAAQNPQPTARTVSNVPTSQPCTPRTDWPQYTVQSGDTTSSIAQRVNSTVATIAAANCLSDPALIRVGQALRMPSLPPSTPVTAGFISVNPFHIKQNDTHILKVNRSVIVTWANVPSNVARVEFYITHNFTDYQRLSEDPNARDGASFVLVVPVGLNGYIVASGNNASGQEVAVSPGLPVRADTLDGIVGDIFVSPVLSTTNDGYVVQEGQTVQLSWGRAQGQGPQDYDVIQAIFSFHPASNAGELVSIGVDTNPADGFTVNWTVPANMEGHIQAGARLPGEMHNDIASISRYIRSTPLLAAGMVHVEPVLRVEGGWTSIAAGQTVTLSWDGLSTAQVAHIASVNFYLAPTGTGIDLDDLDPIATDANPADGISVTWEVTPGISGHLVARATRTDGRPFDTETMLSVIAE